MFFPLLTVKVKLSVPVKFSPGVYVITPVELFRPLTFPCGGSDLRANVNGSAGLSGSVPVSVMVTFVFLVTFTVCALAVGTPGATPSETVAGALTLVPLLTVNVKLSLPWNLLSGVNVTAPVDVFSVPSVPGAVEVVIANLSSRGGSSLSLPVSVITFGVLCATDTVCGLAVGVPMATLSVIVAGKLVLSPSLAVKVKLLSVPWKLSFGV